MRSPRAVVMLVLSLAIGAIAAALAAAWVQQKGDAATDQVVVAAADIELGGRLDAPALRTIAWPSGNVPEGSFRSADALAGRIARAGIQRGEAILEARLAPVGTKGGLSAVIAEGKRAMTVRVNDVVGVAGFALPGNHVDVVVSTHQDGRGESGQISKIVLEHILVLAVAQEANRDETKPKVVSAVTLEVTPAQAETLDLARSVGSLSLVLRNQVDSKPSATGGITKQQLLVGRPQVVTVAAVPRRAPAAAPRDCVEVIKGSRKTTECF